MSVEFDLEKSDNRRALDDLLGRYDDEEVGPVAQAVAGEMIARALVDVADAIRETAHEKQGIKVRP